MWQVTLSPCSEQEQETLISLLDGLGSDGFWQEGPHLHSFWLQEPPAEVISAARDAVKGLQAPVIQLLPDTNWNAAWESSYEPVNIPGICQIHATFHEPAPGYPLHIVIQPQMSFGTGHHDTTRLMIEMLAAAISRPGRTLDIGCGTGVLGIYALLSGASEGLFIDIDPNCVHNTQENLALNGLTAQVLQGGSSAIPPDWRADTLLANINRNVLLADGVYYQQALVPGGHLLLSGFLDFDTDAIIRHYTTLGLHLTARREAQSWQCLCFQR
ncbi:MAG: 50S ribosomal protein L11 methyltransferase [Bacteroidetes bacterium]|nr:50S ribosomal protein L11 methyltransferase [Bacteroidota bacterium]